MTAGVGPVEQSLALALDQVSNHSRRMTCRIDGPDPGHDLVARLDEAGSISKRHSDLHEQLAIEFSCIAHVTALPEIEFSSAEHIARIGKDRFSAFHQPSDMVGIAVRNDDHVNILRLIARLAQPLDQEPVWQPTSKRLVLPLQPPLARLPKNQRPSPV